MLLQSQANQKNIQIQLQSSTNAPVLCDRSQIKQVLINLVKNAIEAMDQPGQIIVKAKENDDKIKISVIDEAAGCQKRFCTGSGNLFLQQNHPGQDWGC